MVLGILGAIGGVAAFGGGVWVLVKGIFRIVSSTEDNTDAIKNLTAEVQKIGTRINGVEVRLAVVEDRTGR